MGDDTPVLDLEIFPDGHFVMKVPGIVELSEGLHSARAQNNKKIKLKNSRHIAVDASVNGKGGTLTRESVIFYKKPERVRFSTSPIKVLRFCTF